MIDKIRTTIYISESARSKAREYDINLSKFIEECIFEQFGYSATRHEIEREIAESKNRISVLQERLDSYGNLEESLEKYCVLMSYKVITDKANWSLERYMRALTNQMKEKPMCDMSFNELQCRIEKYMDEHSNQEIQDKYLELIYGENYV